MNMIKKAHVLLRLSLLFMLVPTLFFMCTNKKFDQKKIAYQYKTPTSHLEIEKAYDSLFVRPLIYKSMVPLSKLTVKERKQLFIDMMLPIIVTTRFELEQDLKRVRFVENRQLLNEEIDLEDTQFISESLKKYKASNLFDLKKRLKPHPISLVLAQAAIESGWGTSRFSRQANNLFGVWTYSRHNGLKSLYNRGDKEIYVRQYEHLQESVQHYFLTIAKARAYKRFRDKRWDGASSKELTKYLGSYSENGEKYEHDLKLIIRKNNFTQYDHLQLDETAFVQN